MDRRIKYCLTTITAKLLGIARGTYMSCVIAALPVTIGQLHVQHRV